MSYALVTFYCIKSGNVSKTFTKFLDKDVLLLKEMNIFQLVPCPIKKTYVHIGKNHNDLNFFLNIPLKTQ